MYSEAALLEPFDNWYEIPVSAHECESLKVSIPRKFYRVKTHFDVRRIFSFTIFVRLREDVTSLDVVSLKLRLETPKFVIVEISVCDGHGNLSVFLGFFFERLKKI